MITDLDLPPAQRTQANYWRAQYYQARIELVKANKGLRRLRKWLDKLRGNDLKFLLSLLSDWAEEVPKGLDPTMYSTGTYEGDLAIKKRVDKIKEMTSGGDK